MDRQIDRQVKSTGGILTTHLIGDESVLSIEESEESGEGIFSIMLCMSVEDLNSK